MINQLPFIAFTMPFTVISIGIMSYLWLHPQIGIWAILSAGLLIDAIYNFTRFLPRRDLQLQVILNMMENIEGKLERIAGDLENMNPEA